MKAIIYDIKPWGWAACQAMRRLWPGCLLSRVNGLSLREVPSPALPGDDWVRVRTLLGGICGTDLAILSQKQPPYSILQAFSSLPMLFGHENVAVVEAVGPAVDRAWVGRRVCVEPTLGCTARGIEPTCPRCAAGEFGACENFGAAGAGKYRLPAGTSIGYNSRTGGAYGEEFVTHVSQLVAVPESLSDEQAVMTDVTACSLHAALRADLSNVRTLLVYGLGSIGLTLTACLRAMGFAGRIDALARGHHADALARTLGADEVLHLPANSGRRFDAIARRTGGSVQRVRFGNRMLSGGYDAVFDCVGSPQSIQESLKWTAARGQVVFVGTGHGGRVDLTPIWFRELRVIGAYGRQVEHVAGRRIGTYQLVHEWMAQGKLDLAALVSHKFRLEQYRQAFAAAMNKSVSRAVKVAFDFRPS